MVFLTFPPNYHCCCCFSFSFHALSPLCPYPPFSSLSFSSVSFSTQTLPRHFSLRFPSPFSFPRVQQFVSQNHRHYSRCTRCSREYEQVVIRHFESASRNTIEDRSAGSIARPIFPSFFFFFFFFRKTRRKTSCVSWDRSSSTVV